MHEVRRVCLRRVLVVGWGVVLLVAASWGAVLAVSRHRAARRLGAPVLFLDEATARTSFERRCPGRRPLNEAIGEAAVRFHRERPMGKFVLGLTTPGNDCSDFVACCVDEGLGVQARFRRHSNQHLLGERWDLAEVHRYRDGCELLPGDVVQVRHSPWYAPNPRSCWHVGIVGSDGLVYDFVKLKKWREPRYGRQPVRSFVRHSRGLGQCQVIRLHWRYRYAVDPLPRVTGPAAARQPPAGPAEAGPEG